MVPIFATLYTFGTYTFQPVHSYLSEMPMAVNRPAAPLVGRRHPVDALGGGRAALRNPEATWVYKIVAADGLTVPNTALAVENEYNTLLTLINTTNANGTSGEIQTLTVLTADLSTQVSCKAALVDMSIREQDRQYSMLSVNLVFQLYSEFA